MPGALHASGCSASEAPQDRWEERIVPQTGSDRLRLFGGPCPSSTGYAGLTRHDNENATHEPHSYHWPMPCLVFSSARRHAGRSDRTGQLLPRPEENPQWAYELENAPEDTVLIELFALRQGLCQMVDARSLSVDKPTAIFERARGRATIERRKEERERLRDRGLRL
jgi:hypothetical protein